MKVRLLSIMVDDQEKAAAFYTSVLGFVKKHDIPMGAHRWLTVVAADEPDGTEVVLEPMAFAPARVYQQELFSAGIPVTGFLVDDVQAEYDRLLKAGVKFSMAPTLMGTVTMAVFEDTCGNHLQVFQMM
ncbi:MAG: VOC family protein [Chitinophagaceae bacterium]|nr:MAG: VOC family protein [Chitinophagaceae bacterium]